MIGPMDYVRGLVTAEVTTADPPSALTAWACARVRFRRAEITEPLTIRVEMDRQALPRLRRICKKRGDKIHLTGRRGLLEDMRRLSRRPVLILGLVLLVVMMTALPKRLWFLRFEGNERLSQAELTAAAEEAGLTFFTNVADIKSEEIKNRMVNLLPELAWAGVQFEGGIATVTVREQEVRPEIQNRQVPANVVAARPGIVTSMSVLDGQALCQVGKAVLEGEILVSGYVDCQTHTQVTQASAEIYALTQREISAIMPIHCQGKGKNQGSTLKISLRLGRKRINLWGNSGILPAAYDKITEVKPLTLPGGYVLPLALEIQHGQERSLDKAVPQNPEDMLEDFGRRYVEAQMLAGKILAAETEWTEGEDAYFFSGVYTCEEMIARQRAAILLEGDTKDDGKNG